VNLQRNDVQECAMTGPTKIRQLARFQPRGIEDEGLSGLACFHGRYMLCAGPVTRFTGYPRNQIAGVCAARGESSRIVTTETCSDLVRIKPVTQGVLQRPGYGGRMSKGNVECFGLQEITDSAFVIGAFVLKEVCLPCDAQAEGVEDGRGDGAVAVADPVDAAVPPPGNLILVGAESKLEKWGLAEYLVRGSGRSGVAHGTGELGLGL